MLYQFAHDLTGLGNATVTLPIAAVIGAWLAFWCGRWVALNWLGALVVCGGVTVALKLYFHACPVAPWALTSPSGHTSLSLFIYGGLFTVTGLLLSKWPRIAVWVAGAVFVLTIAVTRLIIHAHSPSEVVIGTVIGTAALALLWPSRGKIKSSAMPMWPIWVLALVPIGLLHTRRLPTEDIIQQLALHLRAVVDFCA